MQLASLLLPGLLSLATTPPYDLAERIERAAQEVEPRIIELRHQIHQNPELSNREFETARLVAEHLRELGLEVQTGIAHTGVVALLVGGRPGPVVAVRADMDALPVTENTPYEFKSTVRTTYLGKDVGVAHACGHDVHTAVQLGVASVLAAVREDLPGTVKFIFQPAEEGPPVGEEGGASMMIEEGVLENPRPKAIFGLHAFAEMEVGKVGYTVGPAFAAVDHFLVELHGRQAHGAAPHFSIDPVVMAAQVINAFQTIRARNLPPLEPSVVTVGIVRGGERFNIIPETVHLEGTVRTYDPAARDTVERRMGEILDGIATATGGSYDLEYRRVTPATINHSSLTVLSEPSLGAVVGSENVYTVAPTMGGEDFAEFAGEIPGFYFRLGTVMPGTRSGGHHTPTFQADDSSILVGMRVMSRVVVDFLARGGRTVLRSSSRRSLR